MKKFIMLCLVAGLTFGVDALRAEAVNQAGPAAEPAPATAESLLPVFSLEDSPQDSPALAKKKAALRLFKAYGVTVAQLNACRAQNPEAEKTLKGFSNRNGNTLATVMAVIKQHGGLSPDVKDIVEEAIAEEAAKGGDCQALVKAVAEGRRDIYKAPPYLDDYKLIRSK